MTMTPRAKKFRINPGEPLAKTPPPRDDSKLFGSDDDGFGEAPFPTAKGAGEPAKPNMNIAEEIAAIRAEGLTGRQLRLARRIAQKNGIEATSDFEAVRLLRRRGINPFQRTGVLELVVAKAGAKSGDDLVQLPQTVTQTGAITAPGVITEDHRAREILRMQRDIISRRRRNLALLVARMAFYVLLPTLIAAWYFYRVATPLYSTKSEFVIQQNDGAAFGRMGGFFAGTQFATNQDSITVQSYLQSREAMLRLDKDLGFKAHFSDPSIDPIERLDPEASNEEAYKLYKRNVKISFDPTEGIIKLEVVATSPETSAKFSRALIGYAEAQVDQLTQRLREDQMRGARESYSDAEAKVLAAQQRVLTLQEQLGILDPVKESASIMAQINTFELQVQEKNLQLQQLLSNAQPNAARVEGLRGDIARLEVVVASLRASLTQDVNGGTSLASVIGQLRIAEAELETRQVMLGQASQQTENARIEANKQVRYLSLGVSPTPPDEATYPRAMENTALALVIFTGIYLMLSLTVSILKEQVLS